MQFPYFQSNKAKYFALAVILVISIFLFTSETYLPIGYGRSTRHFLSKTSKTKIIEDPNIVFALNIIQIQGVELLKLQTEVKALREKLKKSAGNQFTADELFEMHGNESENGKSNKNQQNPNNYNNCDMEGCFDYTMCPITDNFLVYLYPSIYKLYQGEWNQMLIPGPSPAPTPVPVPVAIDVNSSVALIYSAISKNHQVTRNPSEACVFIVVLNSCDYDCDMSGGEDGQNSEGLFFNDFNPQELSYWFGPDNADSGEQNSRPGVGTGGRNHLIWSVCEPCKMSTDGPTTRSNNNTESDSFHHQDLPRPGQARTHSFEDAMVTSQIFRKSEFRPNFDLTVSHHLNENDKDGSTQELLPSLTPAKREYLATYIAGRSSLPSKEEIAMLLKMSRDNPGLFLLKLGSTDNLDDTDIESVTISNAKQFSPEPTGFHENTHNRLLLSSIFSLIVLNSVETETVLTDNFLQYQLYTILKSGAIPVVIGTHFQFPFSEFIDWSKVALTFPFGRLGELPQILKAISESDIITLRGNGRRVFVKYLRSVDSVVDTLLAGMRTRIGMPPPPFRRIQSPSLYPSNRSKPIDMDFDLNKERDKVKGLTESLGPLQGPFSSPKYKRNVTSSLFLDKYELWNIHFQPFRLFPSTPWDFSVPSEAHIPVVNPKNQKSGIRPTFGGDGGNTKRFWKSLGGNIPPEQFTIVILTYNREVVLMSKLKTLVGVPYLNSVVVVWNSPNDPWGNLTWPDIGVPIHVIKSGKNSLNNRFLPYDVIETDAILSLDDDSAVSHDEMVFSFRVWRENRDRLVGLPGRFHGWDVEHSRWAYETGRSCEYSMVLTGAAFFHKYYAYMYSFEMPAVIREEVDKLMNCEDLAMNFLISYLTQKPSIKATDRDKFTCPTCKNSLSRSGGHYRKRDACINTFTKVYGYTTLMYSQFRADSMQFGSKSNPRCFSTV